MLCINSYIEDLQKNKTTVDKCTPQKLNWLDKYKNINLSNDVVNKRLTSDTLRSSTPELFVDTMVTMTLESYDAVEDTRNHI